MANIISFREAVDCVKDNDVIAVNGVGGVCNPDKLCAALRERFQETSSPTGLTLWSATALGMSQKGALVDIMAVDCPGLFRKAVMGQLSSTPAFARLVAENEIAGFNLPQGVISHLYRAAAGRKPAIISRVGVATSIDPRLEGARLNQKAQQEPQLSEVVTIEGREYLQYFTPKIDVCFICGTAADERGNISFEDEAAFVDATSLAFAVKANGGKVCVQVERIVKGRLHPKMVKIPAKAVDHIVVNPQQMQVSFEKCNPAISGDDFMSDREIVPYIERTVSFVPGSKKRYDQYVVARRAYQELRKGDVVNLGVGIPGLISTIATENGQLGDFTLTNEVGLLGGIPLPIPSFGASLNSDMILDMPSMFDFYDGGNLDGVYVGAAQVGANGDVCVSKVGKVIIGVGGFINLTQSSQKIVYMTSFMDGKGMSMEFKDSKLCILQEGTTRKFVNNVEQVSFSGKAAVEGGQDVLYITERCVFKLTPDGLMLTEIAPGIDLQTDILDKMDFTPIISSQLKEMDTVCFDFAWEFHADKSKEPA